MRCVIVSLTLCLLFSAHSYAEGGVGRAISVDLQDTALSNFLRIIGEVSNLNSVCISPCEDSKITFRKLDTPWDEILKEGLGLADYFSVTQGNVVKVYKKGVSARPPSRTYRGKLISGDVAATDLDNMLRIIAEASGTNVIVTDLGTYRGKEPLRLIDVPWDQALDVAAEMQELEPVYLASSVIKLYRFDDPQKYRLRGKGYTGRTISVDFQNVALDRVLETVAGAGGVKLVGSLPAERITLRLIDVPWDQVLDLVLDDNGYYPVIIGTTVKIMKLP